ncbi:MAG TPA: hypothetical protein VHA82_03555 [Ramlibacter sp.]|nr:hypothetical protein [Ramlibacter sp.]
MSLPDRLETWKQITQIGSSVAIPVILALIGYFVQSSVTEAGLKKDYVQMALGVLKEQPSKENEELRQWAIAVLDKSSPVPIPASLKSHLIKSSRLEFFPGFENFKPEERIECRPVPNSEVLDWLIANEPSRYSRCPNGEVGVKTLDYGKLIKRPYAPASAPTQR